jgi:DNA-directed RNA polymerase subunit RPC12/RpoP
MIKYYCDICGEEVNRKFLKVVTIEFDKDEENEYEFHKEQVCTICRNKILINVKGLLSWYKEDKL